MRLGLSREVYQAFRSHWSSAKKRKIPFLFSLEEWWLWWQTYDEDHGCIRWGRRGRNASSLVMARYGDLGPYAPENVYCATQSRNVRDIDQSRYEKPDQKVEFQKKREGGYVWWLDGKRGDEHPCSRAVITPEGRFGSCALAGDHFGITRQGAYLRAKNRSYGWRFE